MKLALLEDMNDPFELLGVELKTKADRAAFRQLKAEMNRTIGVLCFSRTWINPVLWSHYADRHRGLCLGFDILDEWAKEVTYTGTRLKSEVESALPSDDKETTGYKLITTKYEHWQYEDEVRLLVRLEHAQQEDQQYYLPYCKALQLREVITGPRNSLPKAALVTTMSEVDAKVSIIRSRLAFRSFKVVRNRAAG
ncbi:MAG: DUF2971 domain-containing protein [Burkholderiales bacterium]